MLIDADFEVLPPLAWTRICGGYSTTGDVRLHGYRAMDLRQWGWVMWDASRLEPFGGKDIIRRHWGPRADKAEQICGKHTEKGTVRLTIGM
ncbi:hypothetical protein F4821DRAFT_243305, partial [Hypoxylon rubiginosum]